MRTLFTNIISAAASIGITSLAVAASAPAAAATVDNAPSTIVQTSDLDLQSAAGQEIAMHRIHRAVTTICANSTDNFFRAADCRDQLTANATQSLAALSAPAQVASR